MQRLLCRCVTSAVARARLHSDKQIHLTVRSCTQHVRSTFGRREPKTFQLWLRTSVGNGHHFTRHCSTLEPEWETAKDKRHSELRGYISKLSDALFTANFVCHHMMEDIWKLIEEPDDVPSFAHMLLKSYGWNMSLINPKKRTEMLHKAWERLRHLDVPMQVSQYNTLMEVYMSNEHPFDPEDILEEMGLNSVYPSQRTYEICLTYYCHQGNLSKAQKYVEEMSENGKGFTMKMMNSLIFGYLKNHDTKNAEKILDIIRTNNLKPEKYTYEALINGYLEIGDIDKAIETKEESDAESFHVDDWIATNCIPRLIANNNFPAAEKLLSHEKINLCGHGIFLLNDLIHKGELKALLKVLKYVPITNLYTLLECAVLNLTTAEAVLELARGFRDLDCSYTGIEYVGALRAAVRHNCKDMFKKLIDLASQESELLTHNEVYSLILWCTIHGEKDYLAVLDESVLPERYQCQNLIQPAMFAAEVERKGPGAAIYLNKVFKENIDIITTEFCLRFLYRKRLGSVVITNILALKNETGDDSYFKKFQAFRVKGVRGAPKQSAGVINPQHRKQKKTISSDT